MLLAKELSQQLAQRAHEVAKHLLPNGHESATHWLAGDIHGAKGDSVKICITGEKLGIWCDFATGEKGDLLDLWAKSRDLSVSEAMMEATRYLGIASMPIVAKKHVSFKKPGYNFDISIPPQDHCLNYLLTQRKITANTLNVYKVNCGNGKMHFPYIRDDMVLQVKTLMLDRPNGKKVMVVEKDCEPCLFGWHRIPKNAREVTICEGEIDCMTLHDYGIPALSVPLGAGGCDKWLEYEHDRLLAFDVIYLCMDNDEAGQKGTQQLIGRLGAYRCKIVNLPFKDPNLCRQNGVGADIMWKCWMDAKTQDPNELKNARDFCADTIKLFYPDKNAHIGYLPPWPKMGDRIMFRHDELSVWNGINGHGKSQLLGQVILGCMQQGARVCIASLELSAPRMLERLTRQATGLRQPTREYIQAVHDWFVDRLWVFNLLGNAKSDRMLEVFLYARQRYGVDVFVIDSFMKLDISEDDYRGQKKLMEKLCDFKNEYGIHIHIVVHPRKGVDESKSPNKLDSKGTGAISDLADNCFTVWRNKAKETLIHLQETGTRLDHDDLEKLKKSDCQFICDKQRHGEFEGTFGLMFDRESLQYRGNEYDKNTRFVEYSRLD